MAVDPYVIGPTTLAITSAIEGFNRFLPPLTEIRRKNTEDDPMFAKDVRVGELAAVALTIGTGVIASSLTGSNVPAVVGLITAAGLVLLYESVLRSSSEVIDEEQ